MCPLHRLSLARRRAPGRARQRPGAGHELGELRPRAARVRTWKSVDEFVQEVAVARIYDGVHYRNSTVVGTAMGKQIGELAVKSFPKPIR